MKFKFEEFAKYIHKSFPEDFTLEEVKDLLYLEEDGYNKSMPNSPQKRLLLNRIILEGIKTSGADFTYDRLLFTGVSMWIADNFRGKSSIFKAIGFALTGRDKFTPLIKTWLKRIVLQFTIHDAIYTVVLNLSGAQLKAEIYDCKIDDLENKEPLRSFKSKESFANYMQDLFFEEFDYYPIKRVQANQPSVNLSDADLSWITYYSSIYHQSKDYGNLEIGNQHMMVFQMLLGLQYTYSIHALEAKSKKAEREWNLKTEHDKYTGAGIVDISILQSQLSAVNEQISNLNKNTDKKAISVVQESLNILTKLREASRKAKLDGDTQLYQLKTKASTFEITLQEKQDLIRQFNREVNRQKRLIIEYQEYIESGIFFNNLQVTECPHCDHEVDKNKLKIEKESKICMLCDHEMTVDDEDTVVWEERVSEARQEIFRYEKLIANEEKYLNELANDSRSISSKVHKLEQENAQLEITLKTDSENIAAAEQELDQLIKQTSTDYFKELEAFLQNKVKLENDIAIAEKFALSQGDFKLKRKAELLKTGHSLLLRRRAELGLDTLSNLQQIMLKQLHALGLPSYTRVSINPNNFAIQYYQGEILNNFTDISEGEQLRAKLALYLSLIELDLEKGLGRHPRLIILDSPTKEEGDHHFVEGLMNTLVHIEEKFGEHVQVIVGTANRELKSVIDDPRKLEYRESDEFVF